MSKAYDKKGIPMLPLDVVKVFHFVGARNKKYYMYKQVKEYKNDRLYIDHLCKDDHPYSIRANDEIYQDYEIVQGFGENGVPFEDRKRKVVKAVSDD